VILDVNVLVYAIDETTPQHSVCRTWLETALNGAARVGFPWPTTLAFLRITTHPRIMTNPLSVDDAWTYLDSWFNTPVAWTPEPTKAHADILRTLTIDRGLIGNLIPDAHLAALAIEHGVPLVSCDNDFARFEQLIWINPSKP
jgi:toxin-antitoxin system PIN domain toxin